MLDKDVLFNEDFDQVVSLKEKLFDLVQKILLNKHFINSHQVTDADEITIDKKILLISTHLLLNLTSGGGGGGDETQDANGENENDEMLDDDSKQKNAEINRIIYLYSRVSINLA
jgi:acyl-CoA hydrolase